MNKPAKIWNKKPTEEEAIEYVQSFFKVLGLGELDKAKQMVHHSNPYWENEVYKLWHHLNRDQTIQDRSFEAGAWKKSSTWNKDLTITKKAKWLNPNRFIVDIICDGKPTGYVADFQVDENEDNEFFLTRILFTERDRHPWL